MDCQVLDLGLIEYERAWKLQDEYAGEIARRERAPTLLLLEHPHVYTFGRRGQAKNLLWGESLLRERGVSVQWVDRGGDVSYHGPGQLVGYPLVPLGKLDERDRLPQADYVGYVRRLEETLIIALARLGLAAGQRPGLRPAKIAAIGVKVDSHGISRHGFALNVNPDMEYWDGIIACGLMHEPVVSLGDLFSPPPAMERVKREVTAAFGAVFDYEMK